MLAVRPDALPAMKLRRCSHLLIEPRDTAAFDLQDLTSGGAGLRRRFAWIALVPWRAAEVELTADEVAALAMLHESQWIQRTRIEAELGTDLVERLLQKGVAIEDSESSAQARDQCVRDQHWTTLSVAAHCFARWSGVDDDPDTRPPGYDSMHDLVDQLGAPPPAVHACTDATARVPLPEPAPTALDALWRARATCRNFDLSRGASRADLGRILAAVFGIHGGHGAGTPAEVVKKNHPSGGALHPLEAYVLVQRVDGLMPGLYHFHAQTRALEPLPALSDLAAFALTCVSGQRYLAEAPVLIVMAVRFARCFWKYRGHAKAYRTLLLEAGHASQNLYLAATERGLGAFITAAINEVEIELGFGLDPLREGVLAVCGFGPRAADQVTAEFDPAGAVWPLRD